MSEPLKTTPEERQEQAYIRGERRALASIIAHCARELDYPDTTAIRQVAHLIKEREDAIAILRSLCEEYGDNDWEPSLYLADIVEKHLGDYLEQIQGRMNGT